MEQSSLANIVNAVIQRSRDTDIIVPTWIANQAYLDIDPDEISPKLVRLGCTEHLKQIARTKCRQLMAPQTADEIEQQQGELWDLQTHYPQEHSLTSNETAYIKRELMTWSDIVYNHNRMDNAGDTLKSHAKRLLQYGIDQGLQQTEVAA